MSLINYTVLICDVDQVYLDGKQMALLCHEEITDENTTKARIKAKSKGWTFAPYGKTSKKKLDVCYKHSQMYANHQIEIDKRAADPIFAQLRAMPAPSKQDLEAAL